MHNVAPTASAGGPYSGAAGTPISVTGTATDPGLPGDVLTFAWDCDNNGTTDATGATAACTYSFAGTYTAKLKVTDHDGGVGTATASVTVGLPASTAALTTGEVRWSRGIVTATEIISDGHHFTLGLIGYDGDGRKFASATVQSVVVTGTTQPSSAAACSSAIRSSRCPGGSTSTTAATREPQTRSGCG